MFPISARGHATRRSGPRGPRAATRQAPERRRPAGPPADPQGCPATDGAPFFGGGNVLCQKHIFVFVVSRIFLATRCMLVCSRFLFLFLFFLFFMILFLCFLLLLLFLLLFSLCVLSFLLFLLLFSPSFFLSVGFLSAPFFVFLFLFWSMCYGNVFYIFFCGLS